MSKKYFSKDNWLVKLLAVSAASAAVFFFLLGGSVVENIGLVKTSQLSAVIMSSDDDNRHDAGTMVHTEHDQLFALVPSSQATHVALNSGDWFSTNTWENGLIPSDNAKVLIPEGIAVTYEGESDARLFTVRVDGSLQFGRSANSKIVFDTMVIDADGELIIGTKNNPIPENINIDLVIANNGNIDVSWDPSLISRGLISHGNIEMHGNEKTTHGKVQIDPMKGATSITMKDAPDDWNVGDTLVIAGTHYEGFRYANGQNNVFFPPEDDVVTITNVNGKTVSFTPALAFDHDTPRSDLKTSVGNYTRNITIRTENGSAAKTNERGHVMFMHSNSVDVRYVAFNELGRTDKSGTPRNVNEFNPITPTSNVKGRYSLHFHKLGVTDVTNPAMAVGNAVYGAPGWGYVHHDSNAVLDSNVSYNTFGSGYVAETGNEIGTWSNNLAIFSKGYGWMSTKIGNDSKNFDNGRTGDGFTFQGRLVRVVGNIAASTNIGFDYMHRGRQATAALDGEIDSLATNFQYPEAVGLRGSVNSVFLPILSFEDNEVFSSNQAVIVLKASHTQGHDINSVLRNFKAWNVARGANFEYTSHYTQIGFELIARDKYGSRDGMTLGKNSSDMTVVSPKISGFEGEGIVFNKETSFPELGSALINARKQYVVVNPDLRNNGTDYADYIQGSDTILSNNDVVPGRFDISFPTPLIYDAPSRSVTISGMKTDSLGSTPIPAGFDINAMSYNLGYGNVVAILEEDGYRTLADGTKIMISEQYFSDRFNGEVHKIGVPVAFPTEVSSGFGLRGKLFSKVKDAGQINLNSTAPTVNNVKVNTGINNSVTVTVLSGASDPDGDTLTLDGIGHATHGTTYAGSNNKIIYKPDLNYRGTDSFKFWVTDNNGNYTPGVVSVGVGVSAPTLPKPVMPTLTIAGKIVSGTNNPTQNQADADNDGISDSADNCPSIANASQANYDNDSQGDACDTDDDNDGIADSEEISGCQFNSSATCGVTTTQTPPQPSAPTTQNPNQGSVANSPYEPNSFIQAADNVNVRQTPGGSLLGVQAKGSVGRVLGMTPVSVDGFTYIPVNFNSGPDGWVADAFVRFYIAETETPASSQSPEVTESQVPTSVATPRSSGGGSNSSGGSSNSGSSNNDSTNTTTKVPTSNDSGGSSLSNNRIRTTSNLNVRTTPGGNLVKLAPLGSVATKISDTPVVKDGQRWIQVRFEDGTQGYVAETYTSPADTSATFTNRVRTTDNLNY